MNTQVKAHQAQGEVLGSQGRADAPVTSCSGSVRPYSMIDRV